MFRRLGLGFRVNSSFGRKFDVRKNNRAENLTKVTLLMFKLTRNRLVRVSTLKKIINMCFGTITCNPCIYISSEIAPLRFYPFFSCLPR